MLKVSVKRGRLSLANVRKALGCLTILAWLAASVEGAEAWRPWPFGEDKPGKPDRVIAMWTDTVLTRSDTPPVRGFGGRLMFYEGKKEKPIKVDGVLVVYAFDEVGRDPNSARPDRKYVFTQEQLPAHYSKSKIGHSYSVWIPWDGVGGMQKEISLIVRFESKNGTPIVGDQHRLLLPGVAPQPRVLPSAANLRAAAASSASAAGDVRRTSYEAATPSDNAMQQNDGGRPTRMTTATFAVPPSMASRPGYTGAPNGNGQPYLPPPPWWNRQAPNGTSPGYQTPQTTSPASSNSTTPPVGYPLGRQRPLGEPLAPLSRDRAQWPQRPEGSPSAPGSQPGSGCANGLPANQSAVSPARN